MLVICVEGFSFGFGYLLFSEECFTIREILEIYGPKLIPQQSGSPLGAGLSVTCP